MNSCIVYDRRKGSEPSKTLDLTQFKSYDEFVNALRKVFNILQSEEFVICHTNREVVKNESTFAKVNKWDTLYIVTDITQDLSSPVKSRIEYIPHYDTLIKSGLYEYYASEGQNPLSYAFAELIDNSLSATANNVGTRNIELRLLLDDNLDRTTIFVIDNGHGMTPRQLNDWAIYRLSKFNKNRNDNNKEDLSASFSRSDLPRSLNSEISFFGVGGKQAAFFIGNSAKVMTKTGNSCDVHEFSISKQMFEEKERKEEFIYDGFIVNRKPADCSHISKDDEYLREVILEEVGKESFTCVVIQGISLEHVQYLKSNFDTWCTELAHVYHYYLHGPRGNEVQSKIHEVSYLNLNIKVKMAVKGQNAKCINLRDIDYDLQSLYVRSCASTFEFSAVVEGIGVVEGILRYHPFLFDRETYPFDIPNDPADDHSYELAEDIKLTRRPIFECYWNGRLIPYTSIDEFDWCSPSKKYRNIPSECYNRLSGALWTNDVFQVSTNKLTFIDLELKLRDKTNVVFSRIVNGLEKRGNIDKQFKEWLQECHENLDKQIRFLDFQGLVVRHEEPKAKQYPWSTYKCIEWDGKMYKEGQLIKLQKVHPVQYGAIHRFLLYGEHDGDLYSTGGFLEIILKPQALYGDVKTYPLKKLDRNANEQAICKWIEEEEGKLPDKLVISWPNGDELIPDGKIAAGTKIGDIKVEIVNRREEAISKLPGSSQKKLLVELKIIHHCANGDRVVNNFVCHFSKQWSYWFKKMENVTTLGSYTLHVQAIFAECGGSVYAGKELPSHRIRFQITEAEAKQFTITKLDKSIVIGKKFQIVLRFEDQFGNCTKPSRDNTPILEIQDLNVTYVQAQVRGHCLVINDVVVNGLLTENNEFYELTVTIPGFSHSTHEDIQVSPGQPHHLIVAPNDSIIRIENGTSPKFEVHVRDVDGNTCISSKLSLQCRFASDHNLPNYETTFNASGDCLLTGPPIKVPILDPDTTEKITAIIEVLNRKDIGFVERSLLIIPSSQIAKLELSYVNDDGEQVEIRANSKLTCSVGQEIHTIKYRLYDEAGRLINTNDKSHFAIKVNWAPKFDSKKLPKGTLPNIKVPCSVTELKYCSITFSKEVEDFGFTIESSPGQADHLKCCWSGKARNVKVGETFPFELLVMPVDLYGNPIKKITRNALAEVFVTAEGLCEKKIVKSLRQGEIFVIQGITFESGNLGPIEMCVRWNNIEGHIKLNLVAGGPSRACILPYDKQSGNGSTLKILNGQLMPNPILVQVYDAYGNPSTTPNLKVQLVHDSDIKFCPLQKVALTNAKGNVDFGKPEVTAKQNCLKACSEGLCTRKCFGTFNFSAKVINGQLAFSSEPIRIHIQSDSNKPTSLDVKYNSEASFVAGKRFPEFKVTVMAEDGSLVVNSLNGRMVMLVCEGVTPNCVTNTADMIFLQTDICSISPATCYFRNLALPELAGMHTIQFNYTCDELLLSSDAITIEIIPDIPVKLVPTLKMNTPIVSNSSKPANRVIIKTMELQLRDAYDNVVHSTFNGNLVARVSSNDKRPLPTLFGGAKSIEFPLVNSMVILKDISVDENCPGIDGKEYMLMCDVIIDGQSSDFNVHPFSIPFLFYNDVAKQIQMEQLSKERDVLKNRIEEYKRAFETSRQLSAALNQSVMSSSQEEQKLRKELEKCDAMPAALSSIATITYYIKEKTTEMESLAKATGTRRRCTLQRAPVDPDTIGKLGHLAEVDEDDVARVLSWHMAGDMDCIITRTMEKAMDIYYKFGGIQQVLSLDAVFRKNIAAWDKPLPHASARGKFVPKGNPVYAKNLLIFSKDVDECKVVFGRLLGDAIILDTLDDATAYRKEVVKYTYCPTLLTRQGERILSSGKFGGQNNKAPPIEKLRGVVFGQPLPNNYTKLTSLLEILNKYRDALEAHQSALKELQEYQNSKYAQTLEEKKAECRKMEKELMSLEKKLGTDPVSPSQMTTRGVTTNLPPELMRGIRPRKQSSPQSPPVSERQLTRNTSMVDNRAKRSSTSPVSLVRTKRSRL